MGVGGERNRLLFSNYGLYICNYFIHNYHPIAGKLRAFLFFRTILPNLAAQAHTSLQTIKPRCTLSDLAAHIQSSLHPLRLRSTRSHLPVHTLTSLRTTKPQCRTTPRCNCSSNMHTLHTINITFGSY